MELDSETVIGGGEIMDMLKIILVGAVLGVVLLNSWDIITQFIPLQDRGMASIISSALIGILFAIVVTKVGER